MDVDCRLPLVEYIRKSSNFRERASEQHKIGQCGKPLNIENDCSAFENLLRLPIAIKLNINVHIYLSQVVGFVTNQIHITKCRFWCKICSNSVLLSWYVCQRVDYMRTMNLIASNEKFPPKKYLYFVQKCGIKRNTALQYNVRRAEREKI